MPVSVKIKTTDGRCQRTSVSQQADEQKDEQADEQKDEQKDEQQAHPSREKRLDDAANDVPVSVNSYPNSHRYMELDFQ